MLHAVEGSKPAGKGPAVDSLRCRRRSTIEVHKEALSVLALKQKSLAQGSRSPSTATARRKKPITPSLAEKAAVKGDALKMSKYLKTVVATRQGSQKSLLKPLRQRGSLRQIQIVKEHSQSHSRTGSQKGQEARPKKTKARRVAP